MNDVQSVSLTEDGSSTHLCVSTLTLEDGPRHHFRVSIPFLLSDGCLAIFIKWHLFTFRAVGGNTLPNNSTGDLRRSHVNLLKTRRFFLAVECLWIAASMQPFYIVAQLYRFSQSNGAHTRVSMKLTLPSWQLCVHFHLCSFLPSPIVWEDQQNHQPIK